MPRHNPSAAGFVGGACKIRKRGCSSSSSSSSVLHNYRFKRAILVARRGGSTTPVPKWRMNAESTSSTSRISEASRHNRMHAPVSARKLANALWELNKIPSPQTTEDFPAEKLKKEILGRAGQPGSCHGRLSDPSHSPVSGRADRSRSGSHRRTMAMVSQRTSCNDHYHRAADLLSNASLMEVDAHSQGLTSTSSIRGSKSRLKDLRNGLRTFKELLKLLGRIWGVEDQHSYGNSLVSALQAEVNRAQVQVNHLIQEHGLDHDEINYLKKRFMEEKSTWKSKEQVRIRAVVKPIMEELESEKKLRRRAEKLNKKLGVELADTRTLLLKTVRELERERKSREIIEQVCNEFVRGIGEDKAEVEQLKKEATKVREELEKEREMLQLADEWREERVHMKLSEAKVQFELKNAAVDQLRNELEAFLTTKRTSEQLELLHPTSVDEREEGGEVEAEEEGNKEEGDDEDGGESEDSDLHSIELNMDNNNRSYSWNYVNKLADADTWSLASLGEKRLSNNTSQYVGVDLDQDVERYKSVKGLRDHMLASRRITVPRGLSSPTRQWNRFTRSAENEQSCI